MRALFLTIFLLILSSITSFAENWYRLSYDDSNNAMVFYLEIDSKSLNNESIPFKIKMRRNDYSYAIFELSLNCKSKHLKIQKLSEYTNTDIIIGSYTDADYKLIFHEKPLLTAIENAVCNKNVQSISAIVQSVQDFYNQLLQSPDSKK